MREVKQVFTGQTCEHWKGDENSSAICDMINLQDAQQNAGATVPASGAGITSALDAVISGFVVANIS